MRNLFKLLPVFILFCFAVGGGATGVWFADVWQHGAFDGSWLGHGAIRTAPVPLRLFWAYLPVGEQTPTFCQKDDNYRFSAIR